MRKLFPLLLLLLILFVSCAPAEPQKMDGYTICDRMVISTDTKFPDVILAEIETELGVISLELYGDKAPIAVENFTTLAKRGYYDGVTFHRIVDDMMIQGGDPTGTGMGGDSIWGLPFAVEYTPDMALYSGALAMANNAGKNTSHFFIVDTKTAYNDDYFDQAEKQMGKPIEKEVREKYKKQPGLWWLEGQYTVFGQVTDGMEIVHQICSAPLAEGTVDSPASPVVIRTVRILTEIPVEENS